MICRWGWLRYRESATAGLNPSHTAAQIVALKRSATQNQAASTQNQAASTQNQAASTQNQAASTQNQGTL